MAEKTDELNVETLNVETINIKKPDDGTDEVDGHNVPAELIELSELIELDEAKKL